MKMKDVFTMFHTDEIKVKNPYSLQLMDNPELFPCCTDRDGKQCFFALDIPKFDKEEKIGTKMKDAFTTFHTDEIKVKNSYSLQLMDNPELFPCGTDSDGKQCFFALDIPKHHKNDWEL